LICNLPFSQIYSLFVNVLIGRVEAGFEANMFQVEAFVCPTHADSTALLVSCRPKNGTRNGRSDYADANLGIGDFFVVE
jgi:hypothetical protein